MLAFRSFHQMFCDELTAGVYNQLQRRIIFSALITLAVAERNLLLVLGGVVQ